MIVFQLTMPDCGKWNKKWVAANQLHIQLRNENQVPQEYWGKDFYYRWDDGWIACVSVRRMDDEAARELKRKSAHQWVADYAWMVDSICTKGEITPDRREESEAHGRNF